MIGRVVILILLSLSWAFTASAQELVAVPGTGVSLVPPQDFDYSADVGGFWEEDSLSSIVVAEMPAEASEPLFKALSNLESAQAALASQGITVAEVAQMPSPLGRDMLLIRGSQEVEGGTYSKWIAGVPGDSLLLVTFNLSPLSDVEEADVRRTMASLVGGHAATLVEKIAALPFTFQPCDSFPVVEVSGGIMVLMTETGMLGEGGRGMVLRFNGFEGDTRSQRDLAVAFMGGEDIVSEGPASFGDGGGYRAETFTASDSSYSIALTFTHERYSVVVTTIATDDQRQLTRSCLESIAASFKIRD